MRSLNVSVETTTTRNLLFDLEKDMTNDEYVKAIAEDAEYLGKDWRLEHDEDVDSDEEWFDECTLP